MSRRSIVVDQDLKKHFPVAPRLLFGGDRPGAAPSTTCRFTVATGETLGLVGESGSGKSTLGRAASCG